MGIFVLKERRVVIMPSLLLIPEFKAVVEKYPKDYMAAFCYVNYMTDPTQENPYLEMRSDEKEARIKKDFPGTYKPTDPEIQALIKRVKEDFIDLPEDKLYAVAKSAIEKLEDTIANHSVGKMADVKNLLDILSSIPKVTQALQETRAARNVARAKSKGGSAIAYDL